MLQALLSPGTDPPPNPHAMAPCAPDASCTTPSPQRQSTEFRVQGSGSVQGSEFRPIFRLRVQTGFRAWSSNRFQGSEFSWVSGLGFQGSEFIQVSGLEVQGSGPHSPTQCATLPDTECHTPRPSVPHSPTQCGTDKGGGKPPHPPEIKPCLPSPPLPPRLPLPPPPYPLAPPLTLAPTDVPTDASMAGVAGMQSLRT